MRIKPNLRMDVSEASNIHNRANRMRQEGVEYVHGSDLNALLGVARHGSILSANDRDHYGVVAQSGERGHTLSADSGQPIRRGISMYPVDRSSEALHYTSLGSGTPVMFGISGNTPMAPSRIQSMMGHALSEGSISHDNISKIYVPEGHLNNVRNALWETRGSYASVLTGKLKESNEVFN